MTDRDSIQQQMLELIYGLLSDEESAELAERISSDRALAVAYAELKEQTELLADATRAAVDSPPDFEAWKKAAATADNRKSAPQVPDSHAAEVRKREPAARPWVSRTLQIVSALAACLLLLAVGYPYFAADPQGELAVARQQADLADDFLAVSVSGPRLMAAQLSNRFEVSIQNAAQEPVDAEVEYTFKSTTGSTVYYGRTQAVAGEVIAEIPPDEVSSAALLEVVARHGDARSQLGLDLQVAPQKPIAILQTDRPFAEPGETVSFRAVVLDPQTQQEQSAQLDFYWKPAEATQLAAVDQAEQQTRDGVATGTLEIPAGEPPDQIELAVQSPLLHFQFAQTELPVVAHQPRARANLRRQGFATQQQVQTAQGLAYHVVPEGGNLVAGVQNRVYYQALSQALTPPGEAQVVDAQRQLIQGLPPSQTELGWFLLVPEATQQYSLELNQAAQQIEQPLVPVRELPATLQVTNGVVPADQPLEVDVRVAQANTTMALVVGDDGATIGHHLWDVGANAPITQPITVDLPSGATGAQRVRLYHVGDNQSADPTPQLLAERIVYRTPVRRFNLDVEGLPEMAEPGQALNLQIDVTNEYDNPAPATLGVQLHAIPPGGAVESPPLGLEAEALLTSRVRLPVGGQPLPDEIRTLEQDPARFDQLLALSQWREPASSPSTHLPVDQPLIADTQAPTAEPLPVVRRSNLATVLKEYEAAVAQVQAGWQARLEQVRQTSSWLLIGAGGVLSVCLLALALVQGLPRVGVWGPGLLVALGSVLWGLLSFNLPLSESVSDRTLIARHEVSETRPAHERRLGEKSVQPLFKQEGEASEAQTTMQLRSAPAPARANTFSDEGFGGGLGGGSMAPPAQPAADAGAAASRTMLRSADAPVTAPPAEESETASRFEPVLWEPRLATNSQGEASLAVTLPETPGRYRLLIDAHGSGRLGTIVRYIDVAEDLAPE